MCGIAGSVSPGAGVDHVTADAAGNVRVGTTLEPPPEPATVCLGHLRLSILDLRPAGDPEEDWFDAASLRRMLDSGGPLG